MGAASAVSCFHEPIGRRAPALERWKRINEPEAGESRCVKKGETLGPQVTEEGWLGAKPGPREGTAPTPPRRPYPLG